MSIKRIKIEYTSNDWSINFFHQFWIQLVGSSLFYPPYTVKDTPVSGTDVQKGVTITQTVQNIKDYIDAQITLAGLDALITTERDTNILYVYYGSDLIDGDACMFGPTTYDPSDVLFTGAFACVIEGNFHQANMSIETVSTGPPVGTNPVGTFTPIGFSGDGLKINNDIYVEIPSNTNGTTVKATLSMVNTSTLQSTGDIIGYTVAGSNVKFNLSPMVKWLMPKPNASHDYTNLTPFEVNSNYIRVEMLLRRYYYPTNSTLIAYDEVILIKNFIRAGERTNKNNLTIPINSKLRTQLELPVWSGYPTAEYVLNSDYKIEKYNNLSLIANKEFRHFSGCENFYVKFLNQMGGYSNWLFPNSKGSNDSRSLGYANTFGEVTDFGNSEDINSEITTKVPAKYLKLMQDLAVSPEIYIYTGGNTWERIISKSNKVPFASGKRVYDVSFKFDRVTNFNPSTLW